VWYRFPVRIIPSKVPVCILKVDETLGSTKYQISTDFVDASSAATIATYNYTIWDQSKKKVLEEMRDQAQTIVYEFPEV
jgi:hypothetical protein